ncbi:helix-turn-helix domain-containing protein [Xanthobacter sp. KR7-225]|uniref:helix-turn-helix domain-containing protein n=1 Tax=Xanthobacter sp. KR7-225 TaxID=3156613 RepID=UPI0032B52944
MIERTTNERPEKRGSAPRVQFDSSSSEAVVIEYHDDQLPTSRITLLDKWRLLQACLVDGTLCSTAKNVFSLLLDHLNSRTGQCNPSVARIASLLSLSRHAIMRSIAELENRGWVKADRKQGKRTDYELRFDRLEVRHLVSEGPEAGCENATAPELAALGTGRENATGGSCRNATRIQEEKPVRGEHPPTPCRMPEEQRHHQLHEPLRSATPGAAVESDFQEWFGQYPKREGEDGARREYRAARQRGATAADLLTGAMRYGSACRGREPRFIARASYWLRDGRWKDAPPPALVSDQPETSRFGSSRRSVVPDHLVVQAICSNVLERHRNDLASRGGQHVPMGAF